jgi:hypothetical protein
MERIEKQIEAGEAGADPASVSANRPLSQKHTDLDILKGCPREIKIGGVNVTQRAFRNNEFSTFATIMLFLGFNTCETERDVDDLTVEDIFFNIAMNQMYFGELMQVRTIEEFLYSLMQFPKDKPIPSMNEITKDEFVDFLAVVLEQNSLIDRAKVQAKKKLRDLQRTP